MIIPTKVAYCNRCGIYLGKIKDDKRKADLCKDCFKETPCYIDNSYVRIWMKEKQ